MFLGGGTELLGTRSSRRSCVLAFSFVVTLIIAKVIDMTMGLRVDEADEDEGPRPEPARRDRLLELRRRQPMKLITAIVKPFKVDDVKDALKEAGVARHDRHRGRRASAASPATPRCTGAPSTRSTSCPRCKIEVRRATTTTSTGSPT